MKKTIWIILAVLACATRLWAGQLTTFATLPAGSTPEAGLLVGKNGDFYGTLYSTGTAPSGAIFDLTAQGYLFPLIPLNPLIGANPTAPLIKDNAGNLYGTASAGGPHGLGTVFEWSIGGVFTRLGAFNGTNGSRPLAPVRLINGTLYGVASAGGSNNAGAFFAVSNGFITNLASFNQNSGINPATGIVPASNSKLYGTTGAGGMGGSGTIYAIIGFDALQSVASLTGTNSGTAGTLTVGPDGNLYGVTTGIGSGTIFEVMQGGRLVTLHQFRGPDGATPNSPLLTGTDGSIYGTTQTQGSNGFGTVFRFTPGANLNFAVLASFDGTNGAYPQGALVQAADGNFYGTSLGLGGAGTVFEYGALAPEIIKAPASLLWSSNRTAVFSVSAIGSQPLTYQWYYDQNPIAGATNPTVSIPPGAMDVGTYSVTVSNAYGEANAMATLQGAAPTIKLDALPATVTNSTITFAGTAASPFGILSVGVSLNGAPAIPANLVSTNASRTNWSLTLLLPPGPNIVQVSSVDGLSDESPTATAKVFYQAPARFTFEIAGSGKITSSRNTNGLLGIGLPITFRATPSVGSLFAYWTVTSEAGASNTLANPLTGIMPPVLLVQALFVTNFFAPLAGTYAGLFDNETNMAPQTAGLFRCVIGPKGGVSGQLVQGGAVYTFSGAFGGSGEATVTARSQSGRALQVVLDLEAPSLIGFIQSLNGPNWSATLSAARASTARGMSQFTMLLPSGGNPASPPGDGYATGTIRNSMLTLSGSTADGAAFVETVSIATNTGVFPVCATLNNGIGLLVGWLTLQDGQPVGTLSQVREPSASASNYREGFTNLITVQSSPWTNSGATALTSLAVSGGGLGEPLDFTIMVNQKNQIIKTGGATNLLTGMVNKANGVFRITFGNGSGAAVTHGVGAILQKLQSAGGFFPGATSGGLITSP